MERRQFLMAAAAAPLAAASDPVRLGFIGLGSRGTYELEICSRTPGAQIVAVADVYQPLIDKAVAFTQGKAAGYQDFRKLLERKDIDAVFVSTPDHWHAPAAILACQAGKDVFCEKPLSHTLHEGQMMVKAARKYNRVFQTGSQQRSAPHFQKVVELIQKGHIGKIAHVECWNTEQDGPEGAGKQSTGAPPEGLNWDLYLGSAPKVPYNRNRFIWNYRWFWDYSGGMMTDWARTTWTSCSGRCRWTARKPRPPPAAATFSRTIARRRTRSPPRSSIPASSRATPCMRATRAA
jgi:hypothetical protein